MRIIFCAVFTAAPVFLCVSNVLAFSPLLQTPQPRLRFSVRLQTQPRRQSSSTDLFLSSSNKAGAKQEIIFQEIDDKSVSKVFELPSKNLIGKPIPYNKLTVGVLKEVYPGENRVAQTPDSVRTLVKAGLTVVIQAGGKFLGTTLF
jgi:Alanine dehydrogenase/PNT, N-terminal domain